MVVHRREARKSTNTGRLVAMALPNSELVVRGHEADPQDALALDPATRPLLLFPHEDARPLDELAIVPDDARPVTLIVPDGNWRQAAKIRGRVAGMRDVACVRLPLGAPSTYRLRAAAHDFGLATLEAVARALRILEGDRGAEVERGLLDVFDAMVTRTLASRGTLDASRPVA